MQGKISNEIKIGAFVVGVILLFVLGLNFLKGNSFFKKDLEFHTFYKEVQGLQTSADVRLHGVSVGKIKEISLQKDKSIKVSFIVDNKVDIPEGTIAKLTSDDLLTGSKIISLEIMEDHGSYMKNGFMEGKESEGILDDLSSSVSPLIGTVQTTLTTIDTVLNSINLLINEETRAHLNNSFASLELTMNELANFANVLNKQTQSLDNIMRNIDGLTANLTSNNAAISNTLNSLEQFSGQLSESDFKKTLNNLEQTSNELNELIQKVNSDEGSLGKLIHEDDLYNNLNSTLESIDGVLQEVKGKPGKYLNISVFPAKQK
ncbi:MAG TPA: MlaD family protein [Chitinophagaceae bacterium]|nr:MlaD family protein [Chitinophagaceae bacterium]